MLTPLEELSFKIHSVVFGYSSPLPIKWNPEYLGLVENKPRLKWIPWMTIVFLTFLHILVLCPVVLLLRVYVYPDPDFFPVTGVIIGAMVAVGLAAAAILHSALAHSTLAIFNQGFELLRRIQSESVEPLGNVGTGYGKILCFLMLSMGGSPLVLSLSALLTGFDALNHLLEMILLEDPKYRSVGAILGGYASRLALSFLSMEVGTKTVVFLLGCGVVTMRLIGVGMGVMSQSLTLFLRWYTISRLAYVRIEALLNTVLHAGLALVFWSSVTVIWLLLCGPERVHPVAYLMIVVLAANLLLCQLLFFPPMIRNCERLVGLVEDKRRQAKQAHHLRFKTKETKILLLSIRAIRPIKVYYGSYFFLGKDFMRDYLDALMLRTIDVIMIFGV